MAKNKKSRSGIYISLAAIAGLVLVWFLTPSDANFKHANLWQRAVNPGPLSAAHASLEDNCSACHSSVTGVDPVNCIACHADNETLLEAQPTAFHAHVGTCKDCHLEHQGRGHRPTTMDHTVFAQVGLWQAQLDENEGSGERQLATIRDVLRNVDRDVLPHSRISRDEYILNCVNCHSKEDPHAGFFGDACATCHATDRWSIAEYVHPKATSQDCSQCHKTPPSHLMPMFLSMCAKSLGKSPHSVSQCYVCHTVFSWNDMKGAPWHRKTKSHRALRD